MFPKDEIEAYSLLDHFIEVIIIGIWLKALS